jgi:hypothetical protein
VGATDEAAGALRIAAELCQDAVRTTLRVQSDLHLDKIEMVRARVDAIRGYLGQVGGKQQADLGEWFSRATDFIDQIEEHMAPALDLSAHLAETLAGAKTDLESTANDLSAGG